MSRLSKKISMWAELEAPKLFILPTVIIILCLSIYPLIISAYLSLSRFKLIRDGFELKFIGLRNFKKLIFGSQQYHFVGDIGELMLWELGILVVAALLFVYWIVRYIRAGSVSVVSLLGRVITAVFCTGLLYLVFLVINGSGRPGTIVTTLFYVVCGVGFQFLVALLLAVACAQKIKGKNLFRTLFFIPIMVTPVGIAYAFRMLMDMSYGPFSPIAQLVGVSELSWASDPWLARMMVLLGESWQWIPFLFIVLLAAIESQPKDQVEAAKLDGAGAFRVFKDITLPSIAPVAATAILIRMIEAFKIIDLPNILTNGGPGIATESLTLHSFIAWRTQDLGGSAAVGYSLLFISLIVCISFFNFIGKKAKPEGA